MKKTGILKGLNNKSTIISKAGGNAKKKEVLKLVKNNNLNFFKACILIYM